LERHKGAVHWCLAATAILRFNIPNSDVYQSAAKIVHEEALKLKDWNTSLRWKKQHPLIVRKQVMMRLNSYESLSLGAQEALLRCRDWWATDELIDQRDHVHWKREGRLQGSD